MTRSEYWQSQLDNCTGRTPKPPLPRFRESGIERWAEEREREEIADLERLWGSTKEE